MASSLPWFEILLGAAGGLTFGWTKHWAEKKGIMVKLDPKPEALQIDQYLYDLFAELSVYRHYHEKAFVESVNLADRVLFRYKQLKEGKIHPLPGDVTRIRTHRNNLMFEVQKLLTLCQDSNDCSLMRRLVTQIMCRISEYVAAIETLCSTLRAVRD